MMGAADRKVVSLGYEIRNLEDTVSASLLLIENLPSQASKPRKENLESLLRWKRF